MARIYGLNGVIRGKQGNNVFSVQNGTQVLRAYQPVVANPRSLGQREQRSKFSLAGKMSAATPSSAIVGLAGGNPRSRRADFVANLVKSAIISGDGVNIIASVAFEKILFSRGSLSVFSAIPTITAAWSGTSGRENVQVSVGSMNLASLAPAGYGERLVCCLFDAINYNLEEVQTKVRTTTTNTNFYFRVGTRRDLRVVTYTVPFVPDDAVLSFGTSNLYDSEDSVNINGDLSLGAASLTFGNSVLLAVTPVIGAQSQTSNSPAADDMRTVVEEGLMETAVGSSSQKG